jgi:hypothetical protein
MPPKNRGTKTKETSSPSKQVRDSVLKLGPTQIGVASGLLNELCFRTSVGGRQPEIAVCHFVFAG